MILLPARISGYYNVLGLTARIAAFERMAVTHAFSLQHYGASFMDPYSITGEFPGDLSVKLLNRAYMLFASHARRHFVSMVFFFFEKSPFTSDTSTIVLPLGHIRVLKSVSFVEARKIKLNYATDCWATGTEALPQAVDIYQTIKATVDSGHLYAGDTLVQVGAIPYQVILGGHAEFDPDTRELGRPVDPFAYYPAWRVLPTPWGSMAGSVGTQFSTVVSNTSDHGVALNDSITDYMARVLPAPTFTIEDSKECGVRLEVFNTKKEKIGESFFYPYGADYVDYFDNEESNLRYSNFVAYSDKLKPYTGHKTTLSGGRLMLSKPEEALPNSFVIAIRGETEYRPAITLDRCEPYQVDVQNPNPYIRTPLYPDRAPSADRLAPMMLSPIPSFEHVGFIEKYHAAVGQAIYVSHLSPDDSRYAGEQEVLMQYISAMIKEPSKDFRNKVSYLEDEI